MTMGIRPVEEQMSRFMAFIDAEQLPGERDRWEALCRRVAEADAGGAALFHNFVLHDRPDLQEAESYVARSEIMAATFAKLNGR
ncbi:hypothetical protein [Rhizobium fabae]|uniref:Uncharacterized protein n=1 Tax=Rhizobium fabae TaxID=573179 RepID=A0A7W6BAZ2_9HYPH|nr:hypothetical protein [Rhizobium fabae]MBB3915557.1 hypothetical protein [Rhizobium fabae]RUM11861.1 hypothetical protein EFB14_15850 [Rhizobium fabae]